MPRKESEAIPEGNGFIPSYLMPGETTLDGLRQVMSDLRGEPLKEVFGEMDKMMRRLEQHVASLEQDARQPRFAMEADGPAGAKTRDRTEGTAKEVQAMHGDSVSAGRVNPGAKTTSTSLCVTTESSASPCKNGVVVENGATAPTSCLPHLEMRTTTAAGSLLPTDETSTATKAPRLATARRVPPKKYKRCMVIAFLLAGLTPAQRPPRPVYV